jgi:hypothetical protein
MLLLLLLQPLPPLVGDTFVEFRGFQKERCTV